jgi:hypothetical protein
MTKARNSQISGTILLTIIILSLGFPVYAKYGGGTGEPNDPYLIYTAEQLNTIGINQADADKHFKLMADIDLSAYKGDSFNRIGFYPLDFDPSWHLSFTGVFDGNNHTISNFTYVVDVNELPAWGYFGDTDVGLFGVVSGPQGQIKNLGLIDPNIYPAATCSERVSRVGAIAGSLSDGSITNCYVEGGRVSADISVGGLVGSNSGTISNCYTTCDVTWAKDRRLRFIEEPWGNTGYSFGGLVGSNGGQIYNCYATGRIEADLQVGGLVGGNGHDEYSDVVICDSYATGDVSGVESVGGLVGRNDDTIRRCCAFGNVSGSDMVGGLVGINNRLGNDQYIGTVTNSYAMSRTSGNNNVGGMAGVNTGMLIKCYSAGEVSGTINIGGLVGSNQYQSKEGTADNCFWDIEASRQWKSKGGTWRITAMMHDPNTFLDAGWDFIGLQDGPQDIWSEPGGGGYPNLWWQLPSNFGLPAFSGGTGEPNNPYLISTPDELNSIGHNPRLMAAHFKLINDIDLAGVDFFIIGLSTLPFNGVFDGNNHLISHFTFNGSEEEHIGLFRIVKGENAQIKNIGLIDPYVTALTGSRVGSLIGTLIEGAITNCYAKDGSVLGIDDVGDLVGMNEDGAVTDCYTTGPVSGRNYVGGLVGVNNDGIVTACYAAGPVSGQENVSGLVGGNWDGTVKNSYATGPVSGSVHVGGLVGMNWYGTVNACYSIGSVSGDSNIGGLLGNNDYNSSIISCFWDIEASGLTNTCGIQGEDATGCDNIYGKTTIEMQTVGTFINAGWDFVDETANGSDDIWWILEGQGYPKLWWETNGN